MDSDSDKVVLDATNRVRRLADAYLKDHHLTTAIFWSAKALCMSGGVPSDVLRLAECLVLDKQYQRASKLLKKHELETTHLRGCYLASKAAYESKELDEALTIIGSAISLMDDVRHEVNTFNLHQSAPVETPITPGIGKQRTSNRSRPTNSQDENVHSSKPTRDLEELGSKRRTLAAIYMLRGNILEAMENRQLAAEAYKEAVCIDLYCHDAFNTLVHHQMLTAEEETELMDMMPFSSQSSSDENDGDETKCTRELVEFLYKMSLKKYDKPADLIPPKSIESVISCDSDFIVAKAERHFYNCDYHECYKLTSSVLKEDPFHKDCIPVHVCCLMELKKTNELFYLAHKLVDLFPQWVVAWFAVGCYYFMLSKHESARRYLAKATQLDRVFGPAWLAYGHSFALENEHDQAMAAFFKAYQLMRGCHLPLLYIGIEYRKTNNAKLGESFFQQAREIAPNDPFVLQEIGVTHFHNQEYEMAEKLFTKALNQVRNVHDSILSPKWESLLNNLGHTMRKLGRYDEALMYHQQALVLLPLSASTYSAIGFVQALKGDQLEAVELFHKALSLRRDDTFSTTMLNCVMEELSDVPPYQDYPKSIPLIRPANGIKIPLPQKPIVHIRPPQTSSPVLAGISTHEQSRTEDDSSKDDVEMEDA